MRCPVGARTNSGLRVVADVVAGRIYHAIRGWRAWVDGGSLTAIYVSTYRDAIIIDIKEILALPRRSRFRQLYIGATAPQLECVEVAVGRAGAFVHMWVHRGIPPQRRSSPRCGAATRWTELA